MTEEVDETTQMGKNKKGFIKNIFDKKDEKNEDLEKTIVESNDLDEDKTKYKFKYEFW